MALESGTYISDLVITNPASTDAKSDGDNHLRLIKSTVKATFPNVTGAVTATHTELNAVASYSAAISGKNRVINGNFDVWQRGTAFTTGAVYTADRWKAAGATGQTVNRIADHPSQGANGFCAEVVHTSGSEWLSQFVEALNCRDLVGDTVTITAWAKRTTGSANQSIQLLHANTADNFSATTSIATSAAGVSAVDWTQLTLTTTIPAGGANGLEIRVITGGSAATVRVAQVQLELGSVATPFEFRPYGLELALCQRYYFRHLATASAQAFGQGYNASTTSARSLIVFPVQMRAIPSATETSGTAADYQIRHGATQTACSTVPAYSSITTERYGAVTATVASGLTAGQGSYLESTSATAYIGFSAEL